MCVLHKEIFRMKYSTSIALTVLATSLNLPVIAEEQSPIIVTATRTAQTADDSLASVTVITKEQIAQQQANDLRELLTSISGIDMTNNGGMGKTTGMFMRGTSSSHVLVMIDGIKIGSATSGNIAFQHIPVNQIERIEIVRGPRSSLYGSEAVAGVIQIFTKRGSEKEQANFEIGYGGYATNKLVAGVSGKAGNTTYSVNANHFKTNGFDAKTGTETDHDGYRNTSVTFNVQHQISKTSSLNLNTMHASGQTEFDGFYNNNDYVQQTTGLQYTVAPLTNWNMKFNVAESRDESDNFSDSIFKTRYNTTRANYSWQNDINLGTSSIFTIGADYQNDSVLSTTDYNETSRDNIAGFIQHQWNGNNNDLQVALRNDDNETFGTHTTGNIAWGHNFAKGTRLIASYGTAFKAPTFNDLYWPGAGNVNLKPEESKSTEIELRKTHSWGKASVSLYNTQIDNLISGWPPTNVNKAEINGLEIRLNTKIAGWDTKAELSLLDPRDKETDKILRRRSQQSLRLDMDKTAGNWTAGFSFIGQGHRYDDIDNLDKISGYGIVNLRASYAFSKKTSIKWKIENLFNKEYETAKGYNNAGVSGYVSVVYQGF